jgi:protoporphyrinogen oxidase
MGAEPRILIIGAGPTGLGSAWRLQEMGWHNWSLIDAAPSAGGLASSEVDPQGFTWDLGGHVLFSHYEYFDRLMDDLLGKAWVEHVRESWIWMRERFIPYPLQNNVWKLPPEDLIPCLHGLLQAHCNRAAQGQAHNFREWILAHFGQGLADVFMLPYNRKVWAYDPSVLGANWMGDRVATVNLPRILENLVLQRDDCSWGPNHRFRFPLRGGTGAIWRACCARLPARQLQFGRRAVRVCPAHRMVRLAGGEELAYDHLISTMPLDRLLAMLEGCGELCAQARHFRHSGSHIIGVGVDGALPPLLRGKCWLYFPESEVPFYRVTVFSNYSPHNVPDPDRYWSLLCEVSESAERSVEHDRIVEQVVAGLHAVRLLPAKATLATLWHRYLEYGYPTPFVGRDDLLDRIDPQLLDHGIWSRGRFGAWKYEVSNQDHSLMQGVEAIDHILFGTEETTYRHPNSVNVRKRSAQRHPIWRR